MAITNGILLTTSPQAVFTASAPTVIRLMTFTNVSTSDVTITIYLVKNGATPSTENVIAYNVTIASEDTLQYDNERIILDTGDAIYASTSIDGAVACVVSYFELV